MLWWKSPQKRREYFRYGNHFVVTCGCQQSIPGCQVVVLSLLGGVWRGLSLSLLMVMGGVESHADVGAELQAKHLFSFELN